MDRDSYIEGFIAGQCHDDWDFRMGNAERRAKRVAEFRKLPSRYYDTLKPSESKPEVKGKTLLQWLGL